MVYSVAASDVFIVNQMGRRLSNSPYKHLENFLRLLHCVYDLLGTAKFFLDWLGFLWGSHS